MLGKKPPQGLPDWAHPLLLDGRSGIDGFLFRIDVRPKWEALTGVFRKRAVDLGVFNPLDAALREQNVPLADQVAELRPRYDVRWLSISGTRWIRYRELSYNVYARRSSAASLLSLEQFGPWGSKVYVAFDLDGQSVRDKDACDVFDRLVFSDGIFGFHHDADSSAQQVLAQCALWHLLDALSARCGGADWGDFATSPLLGSFRLKGPDVPHEAVLEHDLIDVVFSYRLLETDDSWSQVNGR